MAAYSFDVQNPGARLLAICILCAFALYLINSDLALMKGSISVSKTDSGIQYEDEIESEDVPKVHVKRPMYDMQNGEPRENTISLKSNADPLEPTFAYYDPRFDRITVLVLSIYAEGRRAYCHHLNANGTQAAGARPYATRVSPEYMVHCAAGVRSPYVALSTMGGLYEPVQLADMIEVRAVPERSDKAVRRPLAVCLAPLFGASALWPLLLQFVSSHRAFGAAHFYFYVLGERPQDGAADALLQHYERTGVGERVVLPTEASSKARCVHVHRCRHNFQINDCVFRTMHRYDFVAAVDIDDMLVPVEPGKPLHQVFREADPNMRYGAFCLRNRWIWSGDTYSSDAMFSGGGMEHKLGLMPMLKFHNTTAPAPPGHTSKCMVRPESVLLMGVHRVWKMAPGYGTFWAPKELALVRHYRNTTSWPRRYQDEAANMGSMTSTSVDAGAQRRIVDLARDTLRDALAHNDRQR